jgi:hypothetical protein
VRLCSLSGLLRECICSAGEFARWSPQRVEVSVPMRGSGEKSIFGYGTSPQYVSESRRKRRKVARKIAWEL